eukprot:362672-Chlamydomonas_euryale.AAC.6
MSTVAPPWPAASQHSCTNATDESRTPPKRQSASGPAGGVWVFVCGGQVLVTLGGCVCGITTLDGSASAS